LRVSTAVNCSAAGNEWPPAVLMNSIRVTAWLAALARCKRGAIKYQLMIKPVSTAGISHTADTPQANAAPLMPSRLQADDELVDALSAATTGPSLRPPR
jgi:hypothetical protein